jgi:hypothetical protein
MAEGYVRLYREVMERGQLRQHLDGKTERRKVDGG